MISKLDRRPREIAVGPAQLTARRYTMERPSPYQHRPPSLYLVIGLLTRASRLIRKCLGTDASVD